METNIPLNDYLKLLKAEEHIKFPDDSSILENKDRIYTLIHKLLYINCVSEDAPDDLRQLASEATQILHDLDKYDSLGIIITAYHR